jgi:hypothetical protein
VIHLTKGIDNTIYFTGKERLTLTGNVFYYIYLKRNNEELYQYVLGNNDESNYKDRFNKFTITNEDYPFAELTRKGDYEFTYRIEAQNTNGDIQDVETGYCFIHVLEDSTLFTQRESTSIFKQRD